MAELCMLPSLLATGIAMGALLASAISTSYCYLSLVGSTTVMPVWIGVPSTMHYSTARMLQAAVCTAVVLVCWVLCALILVLGLPWYWYGIAKLEAQLSASHCYHLGCTAWV